MTGRLDVAACLGEHTYAHAVACTYDFDARFFEDFGLDQLRAFADARTVTVLLDRGVERRLIGGEPRFRPLQANVRYLLASSRTRGRFHPKLYLLASERRGLLLVGSANLTRAGFSWNAELMGAFHHVAGIQTQHDGLFASALRFLHRVTRDEQCGAVQEILSEMSSSCPWLTDATNSPNDQTRLIDNFDASMWDQLRSGVDRVDTIHIVSPYFDVEPSVLDVIARDIRFRELVIWTEARPGSVTPKWLLHELVRRGRVKIRLCSPEDEGHPQRLHAKAVLLVRGQTVRMIFGSANCTRAGLFSLTSQGNVELDVLIDGLKLSAAKVSALLDPSGSSRLLKRASDLPATEGPRWDSDPSYGLELSSAELVDQRLVAVCSSSDGASVDCSLDLPDETTWTGRLGCVAKGRYEAALPAQIVALCATGAVVVRVRLTTDSSVESNPLFLLNLRDPETGQDVRRERQLRDAERDVVGFHTIFHGLLSSADEDGLRRLLSLCNLRLPTIGAGTHRVRLPRSRDFGMRQLDARSPVVLADIAEAARDFCRRHLRRLARAARAPRLDQVQRVAEIATAVVDVLVAQAEQVLTSLRRVRGQIASGQWHSRRALLDEIMLTIHECVQLFHSDYLEAIIARTPRPSLLKRVGSHLGAWAVLLFQALALRGSLQDISIQMVLLDRSGLPSGDASSTPHNLVFHSDNWPAWASAVSAAATIAKGFSAESDGQEGVGELRARPTE